jgi:hypothetical protein
MKIKQIRVPKAKAKEKWLEYNEIVKHRKEKYLRDFKALYFHLKNGKKVIDVFEAIKFAGLNEKNEPKLAISKADATEVIFVKRNKGRGYFSRENYKGTKYDVSLPDNTFQIKWARMKTSWGRDIKNEKLKTSVPIVPAHLLPKGNLSRYYVLWEVEKWEKIPPRDPILLKRITKNLFVALAFWNLTPLERALISGR